MFILRFSNKGQMLLMSFMMAMFSIHCFAQDPAGINIEIKDGEVFVSTESADQSVKVTQIEEGLDAITDTAIDEDELEVVEYKEANSVNKLVTNIKNSLSNKAQQAKELIKAPKINLKKPLRGLGKLSSRVSTATARPFVNATSFVGAALQKQSKGSQAEKFLRFYLANEESFAQGVAGAINRKDYDNRIAVTAEDLINEALIASVTSYGKKLLDQTLSRSSVAKALGLVSQDLGKTDEQLSAIIRKNIYRLPPTMLKADEFNELEEFQSARALIGDISQDDLLGLLTNDNFSKTSSSKLLAKNRAEDISNFVAFSSRLIVPKLVLGAVSSSLGSLALGATVLTDVATGIALHACLNDKANVAALKSNSDPELAQFCEYVVVRNRLRLQKSRAKGFLAGKKFRRKVNKAAVGARRKIKTLGGKIRINKDKSKALNKVQVL